MNKITLASLNLNRTATRLTESNLPMLAHTGFRWNENDNETLDWFPQGIAGINALTYANKKFITVTWYSKLDDDKNRGVRISFVDVTDMSEPINYRHVLLVDTNYHPLKGLHAGGLVFRNNQFHVPDTKNGKIIRVFALNELFELNSCEQSEYFDYRYILKQTSSYSVGITPSFVSYDWSLDKFLVGTFSKSTPKCLQWYTSEYLSHETSGPFYLEMQGAASSDGMLWIACSYGRDNPSRLHFGNCMPGESPALSNFSETEFPPGLEDIHASQSSENLWILTEFPPTQGEYKGIPNERKVFAIRKSQFNN